MTLTRANTSTKVQQPITSAATCDPSTMCHRTAAKKRQAPCENTVKPATRNTNRAEEKVSLNVINLAVIRLTAGYRQHVITSVINPAASQDQDASHLLFSNCWESESCHHQSPGNNSAYMSTVCGGSGSKV